tara:strand:+ start:748 stop:1476 length:729 start_codon:yes stop_codon:yes gene_type:complete
MIKFLYRYIAAFIFWFIVIIFFINFIILPFLANQRQELYLPDVRGIDIEEAKEVLNNFNLKIFYSKYKDGYIPNEVISTSPRAYTKVKSGRDIKLTLAGYKDDIILDNFINLSYRSTLLKLSRLNLEIDTTIFEYSEKVGKDNIIDQYPKAGKKINDDTKIILIVSQGNPPDYYIVPDLINMSLNKGINKILSSGLLVGSKRYEYVDTLLNNTIIQQDQPPYKKLSMPMEINLIISKDKEYE